jgi:LysM repeat protein
MTSKDTTSNTIICPTCGTRLSENATRCLVCGSELKPTSEAKTKKAVQGSRMPQITLNLPVALGLLILFIAVGALVVFFAMQSINPTAAPENDFTPTVSPTITATPTETPTPQPTLTPTLQPPQEYIVKEGDNCGLIAYAFDLREGGTLAIIQSNPELNAQCTNMYVGQKILVPFPTPTPMPQATNTPPAAVQTQQACNTVDYTVQEGDTLSSVAANYAVPQEAIKEFNGLTTDTVFLGMKLTVPLCRRAATPGPSPTPTNPPPYPAPNLLLPADGASFSLSNDTITLQWASIGTLRDNEAYMVVVEDVTEAQGRQLTENVRDTKYIVPTSFRPNDTLPHVMRWYVVTVRQGLPDEQGNPTWIPAGAQSADRVFSWLAAAVEATPTP